MSRIRALRHPDELSGGVRSRQPVWRGGRVSLWRPPSAGASPLTSCVPGCSTVTSGQSIEPLAVLYPCDLRYVPIAEAPDRLRGTWIRGGAREPIPFLCAEIQGLTIPWWGEVRAPQSGQQPWALVLDKRGDFVHKSAVFAWRDRPRIDAFRGVTEAATNPEGKEVPLPARGGGSAQGSGVALRTDKLPRGGVGPCSQRQRGSKGLGSSCRSNPLPYQELVLREIIDTLAHSVVACVACGRPRWVCPRSCSCVKAANQGPARFGPVTSVLREAQHIPAATLARGDIVMEDSALSTGLPGPDEIIGGVLPGDNVVWQVDNIEEYLPFGVRRLLRRSETKCAFGGGGFRSIAPLTRAMPGSARRRSLQERHRAGRRLGARRRGEPGSGSGWVPHRNAIRGIGGLVGSAVADGGSSVGVDSRQHSSIQGPSAAWFRADSRAARSPLPRERRWRSRRRWFARVGERQHT